MKIVALLSGGKDSCYNLVHCAANGHTLVAAASLGPEAGKGLLLCPRQTLSASLICTACYWSISFWLLLCLCLEELDSYMYQTVGQDAIDLVARALDIPLYRRVIKGSAVEQGGEYGSRDGTAPISKALSGDETEDLLELLRTVLV